MRSPRRTFATPMVVTVAVGCSGPVYRNPPPTRVDIPPADAAPAAPPDAAIGPPGPGGGYTVESPPKQPGETRWQIMKVAGQAGCLAMLDIECPKPATPDGPVATCNPPPPVKYACPDDVTLDHPLVISKADGATVCWTVRAAYTCPAGASCNPPPTRTITCPTR